MVGLNSSAFSTYEDNYAAIQQLRDVFAKQVALDARIEKVEVSMLYLYQNGMVVSVITLLRLW